MNLASRLKKLESRRFDNTGLVPRSDAWFAFWEDIFDRSIAGERWSARVSGLLEVIDWSIR